MQLSAGSWTTAQSLELDVLCEVHDTEELRRALEGGADIVGVKSRDLKTFNISLSTLVDMVENIPGHVLKVAESGIDKGKDIRELHAAGYQAFLIGEALMRADDPGDKLQQLLHDAGWYFAFLQIIPQLAWDSSVTEALMPKSDADLG